MIVHLIDGTYELFRHFYGLRSFNKGKDAPYGAVLGVLNTVLEMIEGKATHIGVATDHVIESFRNRLWPDYKTSEGVEPALLAQFHPLEEALTAMGVVVWPMVELEADDALASAAKIASADERVRKVCIWTTDKDLAQCVRDDRVVQVDRRSKQIRNAEGVRAKFGVEPKADPQVPGSRRRYRGWLSGHRRYWHGHCGSTGQPVRPPRGLSVHLATWAQGAGAAIQGPRDIAHRCAAFP